MGYKGITASSRPLSDALKQILEDAERLEPTPGAISDDPDERAFGETVRDRHRERGLDV
jgi:hypothetical protein